MKCFYHSADLDGYCSGAIVKKKFKDCEMIGINYGDKFPWEIINDINETIFMVDFSLRFDDMLGLNDMSNLIWIDHHKTIIEEELKYITEFPNVDIAINGLRRIGIGACALVWEFIYPNKEIPYPVRLLAEYDVWNHENPDTLPFQYGMRIQDNKPDSKIWDNVLSEDGSAMIGGIKKTTTHLIRDICMEGGAILKYNKQYEERYAKGNYFYTRINGIVSLAGGSYHLEYPYKCIAINKALTNSLLFNSVKTDDIDIMIAFCWNGSKSSWLVSLYTDKEEIDVSEIAKKFGGGGHKGAAGFSCDYLPFSLV